MKVLFILSLMVASVSFANEAQEVATPENAIVKKVLPLDGTEEIAQAEVVVEIEG